LGENLGISAGYNHGFARADGRSHALMKLDSDILVLSEGWLAAALDFLAFHADVGMVALHQVNHGMLQVLPAQRLGDAQVMEFGDWPCGSAMLVPRRIFRELGWFVEDRELKYVPDDINFYTRVCRKGYRALFLRDVCVYHQFDLDGSLYRRYSRGKPMVRSVQLALQLVRAYDRGEAPLELFYEKYQKRGD
jgi:GT2 family glycosyltransferase